MPDISQRGYLMPESPIRKLVPYAEEAKKKGVKVYHLNIGQPDIETPAAALHKLQQTEFKVVEYSHSAGILSYREKVAEYYKRLNTDITVDEILVTTGASEAFLYSMMSCMDKDDEAIIPEPFYANINGFAVESGIILKTITSEIESGFALPPISEFEKLITPQTKAIFICNPNNPTGYLYSKEELESLREIVIKHNLFLFVDEVYRDFCYDGKKHFTALHLKGIENNLIIIDSLSKRYSACGVRLGTIISKNKQLIASILKFSQARLSPPTFAQVFGEAAIDTPKEYFDKVLKEYIVRRNVIVESINKIEGAFCPKPSGAFYVVARLPIDDCDKFCQWMLEDFNYNHETVMFAPATGFYSTKGLGLNEIRIAYVLNVNDLKKAMKCLEEALKVYPGKTN